MENTTERKIKISWTFNDFEEEHEETTMEQLPEAIRTLLENPSTDAVTLHQYGTEERTFSKLYPH